MTEAPIETATRAADILRARIAAGRLLPGTKLAEQELAQALTVSRNTLRVAFTQLQADGLVVRIPNRGCFVARPDASDVREIYRVRRMVEPAAALWGELTDAGLDAMRTAVDGAREARDRGDVDGMAAGNDAFHRAIVALTGSSTLSATMDRVLAHTRLVFRGMDEDPGFHAHYVERNAELIERLAGGERELAAEQLRGYLEDAQQELLGHLEADTARA